MGTGSALHAKTFSKTYRNIINTLHIPIELSQYSHYIGMMLLQFSHSIPTVFLQYYPRVHIIFPQCCNGVPIAFPSYSHGFPIVFPQHSYSVPTVFPLYSHKFHTKPMGKSWGSNTTLSQLYPKSPSGIGDKIPNHHK